MSIHFTKMHGLGNDFMVIDGINQTIALTPQQIVAWGRRDTGIGFDQCLLVEQSHEAGVDFFYRIFNANGHEVGQCGNGARCLARFLHQRGLTTKKTLTVATRTTQMNLTLNADETVTVELAKPILQPQKIPLLISNQQTWYTIPLDHGIAYEVHALNVGNPHAILLVEDLSKADVQTLGKQISEHPLFPEQTNVGFMRLLDTNQIELRVYERGCGETPACGSGAVAAVAAGRLYHSLSANVTAHLPGGDLHITWPDLERSIFLSGPATFVYEGAV